MSDWINFSRLREQLVFADVLRAYGITAEMPKTSAQYVGACPLPKHGERKAKSFSANLAKGLWQCFGCKQGGNVIDFAVLMEGLDKKNGGDVRKVALSLQKRFVASEQSEKRDDREPPPSKRPASNAAHLPTVVNPPLDFALKNLERDHPYFEAHKLSAETLSHFGVGFCTRGSLTGRIAAPLHDDSEQIIGYAGLIVDERLITVLNPKYLFPANREVGGVSHVFDTGKFLYNGFRIGKAAKDLIVVQECHTVWSLWQAGFSNAVGLMSDECSDDHAALIGLLTAPNARIWLLTDQSKSSEQCAQSVLLQVAASRLCRWVRVEEQDEIAPDHPLLSLLPRR